MKVLIGYDGSDSAQAAIDDLRRAGLPGDVEALVMSVADVYPQLPPSSYQPQEQASISSIVRKAHALAAAALSEAQSLAAEGGQRVAAAFPAWKVSHEASADSPYGALILKADRWEPDLIVVGSQGRSAVGRLVFGGVSQNVVTYAPCSVRIARRAKGAALAADAPVRLVLGVDGSSNAAAAVSAVADRAWPAGSEVKVIAALDLTFWTALAGPGSSAWVWIGEGEGDGRSWARRAVEAVADELRSAGVAATPMVEEGDPKQVLVEEAQRWEADCIFVGAKGHSRLERFLLGSVSGAVAARAHCSVEVVRPG